MKTRNDSPRALLVRAITETRDSMHAILGMLDLIGEGPLGHEQREQLRTARDAGDRLLRVAGDLDRLAQTPGAAPAKAFRVRKLIETAAELASALIPGHERPISCEVSAAVPEYVLGDEAALSEALLRVLDAAVKATDAGPVCLQVTAITAPPQDCTLRFDVTCAGALATPLGLCIAEWLLAGMGGQFDLEPASNGGCRVALTVPVQRVDGATHAGLAAAHNGHTLDILIAEDNDESFALVNALLSGAGHRLTRARNGREAVEKVRTCLFSLVLMDIQMPVLDGFAATREIREWETGTGRAHIPIVVLSAVSFENQIREGSVAGCSGYLVKPVRKPILLDAVRTYAASAR
jgi:two-component system, sensor histidine kinase